VKKLVRDNIPQIMSDKGEKPDYYVADPAEYLQALYEKMNEEMKEFIEDPCIDEAADVLEVFLTLIDHYDMLPVDVFSAANKKKMDRGGFKDRYILKLSNHIEKER
jgi:predicted house-cleaning noncanonical NTP pyrophosphatase (MazG superfamily)